MPHQPPTDGRSAEGSERRGADTRTGRTAPTTRRRFLAAGAASTVAGLAGCSFSTSSSVGFDGHLVGLAPGDGSELWSTDTGEVETVLKVVDGTLYAGSQETLYALSPSDGSEHWTATFDVGSFPTVLTPTVAGDTVLVPVETQLRALSATDGSEQWRFDPEGSVWYEPSAADGIAVVGVGETDVYGLSLADGSQQWHYSGEKLVHHSGTVANGTVYLGSEAGRVTALSLSDGSEQWTFETETAVGGTPAVGAGTVFFGTKKRRLYAVAASDGTEQWSVDTSGGALNVSTGYPQPTFVDGYLYVVANTVLHGIEADTRESWSEDVRGSFALDVAGQTVYVGADLSSTNPDGATDNYGTVFAYDRASGSERWATFVDGQGVQPPAGQGDAVYAGQETGKVFALATSDGSERWVHEGDRAVRGAPVVTDDAIVVETA